MAITWGSIFKNKPAGVDAPSTLDNQQRVHREAVEERVENEHDTFEDGTSGLASADWRHKEGSARVYYQSGEPSNQPGANGAVLDSGDDGRLWWNSDDDELKCYDGTDMQTIKKISGDLEITGDVTIGGDISYDSKQITSANYLDGTLTENVIFDKLDPFIPNNGDNIVVSGGIWTLDDNKINIISRAQRDNATEMQFRIVSLDGSNGNRGLTGVGITDGDAGVHRIQIAW